MFIASSQSVFLPSPPYPRGYRHLGGSFRTLPPGKGGHIRKRGIVAAGIGVAVIGAAAARGMSRRFAIVDDSMRPAFEPDDWVIAQRQRGVPDRGDVVVFTHPSYPDRFLVKRVIGLPGERITAANGHLHADGVVIADPWSDGRMYRDSDDEVPTDAVWVLGDNRSGASVDSRVLGAIPIQDIGWKVVARYWPPARAGRI